MISCESEYRQYILLRKSLEKEDPYFVTKVVTSGEVVDYVNMYDIYGDFEDYRVYAVKSPGKVAENVIGNEALRDFADYEAYAEKHPGQIEEVRYAGWQPGCIIEMLDTAGNTVLAGCGEDH